MTKKKIQDYCSNYIEGVGAIIELNILYDLQNDDTYVLQLKGVIKVENCYIPFVSKRFNQTKHSSEFDNIAKLIRLDSDANCGIKCDYITLTKNGVQTPIGFRKDAKHKFFFIGKILSKKKILVNYIADSVDEGDCIKAKLAGYYDCGEIFIIDDYYHQKIDLQQCDINDMVVPTSGWCNLALSQVNTVSREDDIITTISDTCFRLDSWHKTILADYLDLEEELNNAIEQHNIYLLDKMNKGK